MEFEASSFNFKSKNVIVYYNVRAAHIILMCRRQGSTFIAFISPLDPPSRPQVSAPAISHFRLQWCTVFFIMRACDADYPCTYAANANKLVNCAMCIAYYVYQFLLFRLFWLEYRLDFSCLLFVFRSLLYICSVYI